MCVCILFSYHALPIVQHDVLSRSADHRESFKFLKTLCFEVMAFLQLLIFLSLGLCVSVTTFSPTTNLAFSMKTLHLKVMTLFHFKLNTLYIRLCLLPCFLQRTFVVSWTLKRFIIWLFFYKSTLFESYDTFSLTYLSS